MKKILITLFLFIFTHIVFAAAVPKPTSTLTSIRFATEATYPPFEYVNSAGLITGFDIDLARALCENLNAKCSFSTQSFDSLIPSLKIGKYDAIIAAIGITAARLEQVDFTQSYYQPTASFIAPIAKHYTLADIKGKTIGVQNGTTFATYLTDKYGNAITMKTYASIQDAFLDLKAGRVDMVLSDTPIALQWLNLSNNNKTYNVIDKPIVDEKYFGSGYGIAVRKNNTTLVTALNQALDEIKANGTYAKLLKQYGLGQGK